VTKALSLVIKSVFGLLLGVLFGLGMVALLEKLPLKNDGSLYKNFGLKRPQVIGFQPFWLLPKADKPYEEFITTFTYFGLTLNDDGTIVKLVNPQEEEPGWTTLKSKNLEEKLTQARKTDLKLSLLVHNSNEEEIKTLLKDPVKHARRLVDDIYPIMEKYGFTDLNLDIESFQESDEPIQQQFTAFVTEVKRGLDQKSLGTLTVEITPVSLIKPRLTAATELAQIADFIVLMAYDFHYINSYLTGPVAPIGGVDKIREYDVETALKLALNIIPPQKLILGIPLYGYEWETLSNRLGAPTIPGGGATASNRRIEELMSTCEACLEAFDKQSQQPYLIFPAGKYFHQIFYENEESMQRKLKLAQKEQIAGVALWALGYEGERILDPVKIYKDTVQSVKVSPFSL
jgi:spore germination protein